MGLQGSEKKPKKNSQITGFQRIECEKKIRERGVGEGKSPLGGALDGCTFAAMAAEQPIIWITGQPGAGKSTIGRALLDSLRKDGVDTFLVDGDDLRALTANADYSPAGREANIRRAQDIALYLSRQGWVAIVAVVAPFKWLREEFKARATVREVYVHTTEIRGREHYHSDEYGAPETDYLDLDTTEANVAQSVQEVRRYADL